MDTATETPIKATAHWGENQIVHEEVGAGDWVPLDPMSDVARNTSGVWGRNYHLLSAYGEKPDSLADHERVRMQIMRNSDRTSISISTIYIRNGRHRERLVDAIDSPIDHNGQVTDGAMKKALRVADEYAINKLI